MDNIIKKRKKVKKHWYLIDIDECPVCGRGNTYRTRMYGRRPKRYWNRHKWHLAYDWCDY